MALQESPTKFASATRSSREEIEHQAKLFQNPKILTELTDAIPNILLILNQNRQIVHANRLVLSTLEVKDPSSLLGLRPGDAMQCAHAFESEGGCGTTEFCQTCGSVRAVLVCQRGQANIQECRIMQEKNIGALDLRVSATPIRANGEQFTVYAATDIADEKRRAFLERIFFHDVLNTAGGLQGYLELLEDIPEKDRAEFTKVARQLVKTLIEEIKAQRELTAAESGDIILDPVEIESGRFLAGLVELYRKHIAAEGRTLVVAPDAEVLTLRCDERLLHRVVGNMIKNALEASKKDESVTVGCRSDGKCVEFWVHNPGAMPRDVQLQIFQRSFTTKGIGRGLGTYSIKLLGEKYLGGNVSFASSLDDGTTFRIRLSPEPPSQS
jgi:signal transduction histidine kinase